MFIIIYTMIIVFLLMIVRRMFAKEDIVILPFDVGIDNNMFSGKAISDLLLHELREIKRIHEKHRYLPIVSEKTTDINMATSNESLLYEVSSFGTITLGSISLSLGQLLIFLKQLFPYANTGRVLTGSLQKYGSSYAIVATMVYPKDKSTEDIHTWIVDSKDETQIIILVKELAFKIAKDLSYNPKAKTWKAFRHFTDALDAFDQYNSISNMNDLEKSREHCFDALNEEPSYPNPFSLLYCIAQAYFSKKQYEDAKNLLKQLLEYKDGKSDIATFYLLGNVFEFTVDNDLAQIYYEKAIKLIPREPIDWSYIGITFQHQGIYDEAIKAYNEAIRLYPEDAIAWNNKGFALGKKGDTLKRQAMDDKANEAYEEAIKAFDEAINLDSNYFMPLNNKGYALNRLERYNEAIEIFDNVIGHDPNFAVVWNNKGYALKHLCNYLEAIKAYEEAIRLDPTFALAWHNKGIVLDILDRTTEAEAAFTKANELGYTD
jgi:tetratricopeptide (TPR) repeat protein